MPTDWLLVSPVFRVVHKTRVQGSRADTSGCYCPSVTSMLSSTSYLNSGFEQSWGQCLDWQKKSPLLVYTLLSLIPAPEAVQIGDSND